MNNNLININKRFKNEIVKTARGRKISSTKWLQRQLNDPFVKEAQLRGYRSRAAFKIIEIQEKFKIFKPKYKVLDLGSAPGGWSQMAVDIVGKNNVVAVDLLTMPPIDGVKFIKIDFTKDEAKKLILEEINNKKFDVVISDMAANTTGDRKTDHTRTLALTEEAFNFALEVLKKGGSFIAKTFQGGTEHDLFNEIKLHFKTVKHFKPESSRKDSVEMYIICLNKN